MLIHGAYVLHTRRYRETSLLVQLFSPEQGVLNAIAKGALRPKSQQQSLLQPFHCLTLTLTGQRSLHTMYKPELESYSPPLPGKSLIAGLYSNELLLRLCAEEDPHPVSFRAYSALLNQLRNPRTPLADYLRAFEWKVFADCGYALDCHIDQHQQPLQPHKHYLLDDHWRFVETENGHYLGGDLLKINQQAFHHCATAAKLLSREVITRIIGSQGLQSWKMFQ